MAEVVSTSAAVAATSARSAKVAALADLLRRLDPDEVVPAVAFLTGEPRQGKIGVGWATAYRAELNQVAPAAEPSLTIAEVDRLLDRLQATTGQGSAATRTSLLAELIRRATREESEFLRRLLTGELRQGALHGVMADAIAKAAGVGIATVRRAAMLSGDPAGTARLALVEGESGLTAVGLTVLRPVLPMLAATAPDTAEAIALCGLSSVEWKLDGARVQAHKAGSEVALFTRNLNEVTSRLPELAAVVRDLPCRSAVLDGEAVGVAETDDGDSAPDAFQSTMSRFTRREGGGGLVVRFFDCLHLDGNDLIDEPLSSRTAHLERVAGPWRVPAVVTDDPGEAARFLEQSLASGHEGVMVKSIDSRYEAGRRGGSWRKVKPVLTFDLVVLGAEWGHGRRRGWLSNLHLGALDPESGGFVMVGKTFKGMTDDLLRWQTEQLQARQVEERGIAVFVRPELVVEIAIDGVQSSTRYPGGVALRFARVKGYRSDKTPAEADTIDSLRALLK